MKCIERGSMFETNSSSVHSIVLRNQTLEKSRLPVKDGYTIAEFGTFGRESAEYYEQDKKLSYLVSLIWYDNNCNIYDMYDSWDWGHLEEAVCRYNGTAGIRIGNTNVKPDIDHQSISSWGVEIIDMCDIRAVRNFIFNGNIGLKTDSD